MTDLTGSNNSAQLATALGGLGRNATADTASIFSIVDTVGTFERITRTGEVAGEDPADNFSFIPSDIGSVTITANTLAMGDYANYIVIAPVSGVTSIAGDIVGAWYGGAYTDGAGRFGSAVETSAEGTLGITSTFLPGNIDGSNLTASRDTGFSATWQLNGEPVVFQIFGFQLDGAEPASTATSLDVSEVNYTINITPEGAAQPVTTQEGIVVQNDPGVGQTHLGTDAIDTYVFGAPRATFSLDVLNTDQIIVSDTRVANVSDTLINIERIQFEDGFVAFDTDGNAGQMYRLYQAAFDRDPDVAGLGHWIDTFDRGVFDLTGVAQEFIDSQEFQTRFGTDQSLDDQGYLTLLYANVLDRTPDQPGFDFWSDQQANGISRADMLQYFSESPENYANVAAEIDMGIYYL